ncbi:uncharacterized protein [Argopecten irradians]|uniref:uncharacterized protein n=1 Tax=Argopecten irradians TaxID=31199 RepID=UPI0037154A54
MSAFRRLACQFLTYRRPPACSYIVSVQRINVSYNGSLRTLSTSSKCFCVSDEEDSRKNPERIKKFTESVPIGDLVQNEIVSYVIGKGGIRIRQTQKKVGCSTKIQNIKPGFLEVIVTQEDKLSKAVELVKSDIQKFQQRLDYKSRQEQLQKKKANVVKITILPGEEKVLGRLFGAKGKNIEQLRGQVGAPFTASVVGGNVLEIAADDESVLKKAVEVVNEKIQTIRTDLNKEEQGVKSGSKSVRIPVVSGKDKVFGRLIGAQGKNIAQLREKMKGYFSVTIVDGDTIEVSADDESVLQKAVELINHEIRDIKESLRKEEQGVKSGSNSARISVVAGKDKVFGRLIGAQGKNIAQLREKMKGYFSVTIVDEDTIEVSADDESVLQKAVEVINHEIRDIKESLRKEEQGVKSGSNSARISVVSGKDKVFGRLIGAQGKNIAQLREKVEANFTVTTIDENTLEISADDESVLQKAVEVVNNEIRDIQDSLLNLERKAFTTKTMQWSAESVPIGDIDPKMIVPFIIGKGGERIRQLEELIGCPTVVENKNPGFINVLVTDEDKLASAVELVKSDIQMVIQGVKPERSFIPKEKEELNKAYKRNITVSSRTDTFFGQLIGSKGKNIVGLREKVGAYFTASIVDDYTLEITADEESVLEKAIEVVKKDIQNIQQDSNKWDKPVYKPSGAELQKVFSGETERLGIFEESDLQKESERIDCPVWDRLAAADKMERKRAYFVNEFDRMIGLTEEGKMWKFPIDNDQDRTEEENVTFDEHVFLEPLIEDFPKKGPIRHFMELVVAGLSKNPHMSVKEKHEHIEWYRNYFTQNQHLMEEELGDLSKMAPRPSQDV